MAIVTITATRATGGGRPTTPMILVAGAERASQVITTSPSNTVSTVIGAPNETVMICAANNAVRLAVAIGADPNAVTGAEFIIGDGGAIPFFCDSGDTRFAVADV